MQYDHQFQMARQDFIKLKKDKLLPPLMDVKLNYLELSILGKTIKDQQFDTLPQFQKYSLVEMNKQTQTSLFTSIVRCLSGKDVITYFTNEKAYIRKEQTFSSWVKCYLTCNSNYILMKKKPQEKQSWIQFDIQKLWISKMYKQFKKKIVFGVIYDKKKYFIGFNQDKACKRIHKIILQLLKQKKGISKFSFSQQPQAYLEFQREQSSEKIIETKIDQKMSKEQRQFLTNIYQRAKINEISSDGEYKLFKNIQHGRILQNNKNSNIKIIILFEKIKIQSIVQSYFKFNQWNSEVEDFRILNRIRQNCYITYVKTKKYSFMSSPRDFYISITFFKDCHCLHDTQKDNRKGDEIKYYFVIESLKDQNLDQETGAVRMQFKQTIQISQNKNNPDTILFSMLTEADFKGFSTTTDNFNMSLHFFRQITSFPKYCKQREVTCMQGNKLFSYQPTCCTMKKQKTVSVKDQIKENRRASCSFSQISIPSAKDDDEDEKISNASKKSRVFEQRQFQFEEFSYKNVSAIVEQIISQKKNKKIIEIMSRKKHQSYSLKERFNQRQDSKKYIQKNFDIDLRQDYICQFGKFKLQGEQIIFIDTKLIEAQKNVFKMLVKQMGSNLLKGKSIMNMSLPVQIFAPVSMLQAIARTLTFIPRCVHKALKASNLIEQMKQLSIALLFTSVNPPGVSKPFNPILGETFECLIAGIPFYFEQISHHPPISSVYAKTKDFQFYSNFEIDVNMGLNSVQSYVVRCSHLKLFKSNTQYLVKSPQIELGGLMFGKKSLRLTNKGFIYEKNNNLLLQYSIGKDKKKVYQSKSKVNFASTYGGIFKVTKNYGLKILTFANKSKLYEGGLTPDDIIEKYCQISGKYYGDLYFDGVQYKSLANGPVPNIFYRKGPMLPSDCIFRLDIIFKIWGDNDKSNQQKQVLENLQRKDRKLRQKFKK